MGCTLPALCLHSWCLRDKAYMQQKLRRQQNTILFDSCQLRQSGPSQRSKDLDCKDCTQAVLLLVEMSQWHMTCT